MKDILNNFLPEKNAHAILMFILKILCIIVAISFVFHLLSFNMKSGVSTKTVESNIKTVKSHDFSDVKTVEKEIKKNSTASKKVTGTGKALTSAQYTEIFSSCVFIGDSITSGLNAYGFLSDAQVFSSVGGSLENAGSNIRKAAKTYPEKAFFTFGMNDTLHMRGDSKRFIKAYRQRLSEFKKLAPQTKIYIVSISVPSKSAIKKKKNLGNYAKFNKALMKMCREDGYKYIDITFILKENPKLYAGDGIHVDPKFYPLYLNEIILRAGL
ncbi:MAG: GDSL-type esterase/lipase family protein [Anaerovoracaceae bacterium]|jgi:hypothetical protein